MAAVCDDCEKQPDADHEEQEFKSPAITNNTAIENPVMGDTEQQPVEEGTKNDKAPSPLSLRTAEAIDRIQIAQTRMVETQTTIEANFEAKLTQLDKKLTAEHDELKYIRKTQEEMKELLFAQEPMVRNIDEAVSEMCHHPQEPSHHIIVAGGDHQSDYTSVEHFCWSTKVWSPLSPLTESRSTSSSTVFAGQIIVAGGAGDTMEALCIDTLAESERWCEFPARLPQSVFSHKSILYEDKLVTIGGRNQEDKCLDSLHELQLVPPYQAKLLGKMPQGRAGHGAELLNDNIFICGGMTSSYVCDCVDKVLMFNLITNTFSNMMPLPYPVSAMATALWGHNVVVLGGCDRNGKVLSTVFMYCIENGRCYYLPDMKCSRDGFSAVVVDDCMVVLGGQDEHGQELKSVECFDFRNYAWYDLPSMKECRYGATAVAWWD